MHINTDILDSVWDEQKRILRDALLAGDIWDMNTGLVLSSYNSKQEFVALFSRVLLEIDETLLGSGFPKLNRYLILNLEDVKLLVINHGDNVFQGIALDSKRVNLGILFNVAMPKNIAKIKEAKRG